MSKELKEEMEAASWKGEEQSTKGRPVQRPWGDSTPGEFQELQGQSVWGHETVRAQSRGQIRWGLWVPGGLWLLRGRCLLQVRCEAGSREA